MLLLVRRELVGNAGDDRVDESDLGSAGDGARTRTLGRALQASARGDIGVEVGLEVLKIQREVQHVDDGRGGGDARQRNGTSAAAKGTGGGECTHGGEGSSEGTTVQQGCGTLAGKIGQVC